MTETILAADIGGTNSRLLLFEVSVNDPVVSKRVTTGKSAPGRLLFSKKYMNQDFDSFIDVAKDFIRSSGIVKPPLTACLAVAGPVKNNEVKFTNRDSWCMTGYRIAQDLGIKRVRLINDFLAVGYGILTLNKELECIELQSGVVQADAPIACIGAGTGLGECFLAPGNDGEYKCFPTEGGHAEFSPRSELEMGLLSFLKDKFKQKHRVSVERVVSGSGLVNIYEYLCSIYPGKVHAEVDAQISGAGDLKGAIIATNRNNCELCAETMKIFISAYGSEAGVAALKWLPYGGLYLTGGLTPKNIDLIEGKDGPFMEALLDKGRVSGMLYSIPIYAVLVENLGERGAHLTAFKDLQDVLHVGGLQSSEGVDQVDGSSRNDKRHGAVSQGWLFVATAAAAATILGYSMIRLRK